MQPMEQDLEPDPGGGGKKIRDGVAEDRRVSVQDAEMRHGRKSKSKRFNGYERHIAVDLDSGLILSARSRRPGSVTEFDPEACDHCALRPKCTAAAEGSGRTVNIAQDERLRKHLATPHGGARLRERVGVEHELAHLVRRQGRRARHYGVRRNLFDLRRASAVQDLEAN